MEEFYSVADLKAEDLDQQFEEWQFFYNWHRPHGALNGKSPIDITCELGDRTPYWGDIYETYDPSKETIRNRHYQTDLRIRRILNQESNEGK